MSCDHKKLSVLYDYPNVTLLKCGDCQVILNQNLYKKRGSLSKQYKGYYSEDGSGRFIGPLEYLVKAFRLIRAFYLKITFPLSSSILDVGCGRGYTLYYLKKYFHFREALGTQIEKSSFNFASKILGLQILNLAVPALKNKTVDLITYWHVLEHVEDHEQHLQASYKLLKQNGSLVIEVPNLNSWTRFISKKYWLSWDPKFHTVYFDYQTLFDLLKKYNFEPKLKSSFSLEYSAFTSTQSLINFFTGSQNKFYNSLLDKRIDIEFFFHLFIFLLLFPVSLLINMLLVFTSYGEVLHVIARKK